MSRDQYEERLTPFVEAMGYANRVVARMPRRTQAERNARAVKYVAILAEWRAARVRWKITH